MKLKGEVLKRFSDSKDNNKTYAPKGTIDKEEYTNEETTYPHIYIAEKERYEQLEQQGYVSRGTIANDKKSYKIEKEEE